MFRAIGHFILGVVRFFFFALAKLIKRFIIAATSLAVGFIGPLLAVDQITDLFSTNQHAWDVFAELADKDGKFGDIILACLPGAVLCLTDLIGHVFDYHFEYAKARVPYLALVILEIVGLIFAACLIAGYVKRQTPLAAGVTPVWFAQFDIAWLTAQGVIVATVVFEFLLACIESYREAQDANWQV